jgi:choline-sulfatase
VKKRDDICNNTMTRREFIGCVVKTSAFIAAMSRARVGFAGSKSQPNIILLMADQFRGDCVGCAGNSVIKTPNLDKLAGDGIVFNKAYTSLPSCTPARATLLTGLGAWRHGMLGYHKVAPHYKNEKPRMLRNAGYYTVGIGKMHWHPQRTTHGLHEMYLDESGRANTKDFVSDYRQWFRKVAPGKNPEVTGIGWNDYQSGIYKLDEKLHPTHWTGQKAIDVIENYNNPMPLYLKVSFARPHSPYDPPKRFMEMYKQEDMPIPAVGDWAEVNAMRGKKVSDRTARGDLGVEQAQKSRRGYYGNISFIDEEVGRIIDSLKKRGLYENSLILFFADHGDMTGDHHLWRKTYAYEGSAHIPMLVRWPGKFKTKKQRGSQSDKLIELRDVLPTFLDAAGVDYDEKEFDGSSMLELLTKDKPEWREVLDLEHSRCYWDANQWNALTDGRYKYIYFSHDGNEQLFDLNNDPQETVNLAAKAEHKDKVEMWRKQMVEHLSERGEEWVKDGKLCTHKNMLLGPNYPGVAKDGKPINA